MVIAELTQRGVKIKKFSFRVPVAISARHVHLSKEDLYRLFGTGYELSVHRDISQPGQYAAQETVTIEGNKGNLENVRVVGPVRAETQVEISRTDAFALGMDVPVKPSGNLAGTPG
ncbi:MAG TPA: phosphate propanoyltransferase, partial [Clostridiales bacterium UBA9856]|nr:phosphate propanoyltransferase [Clostridiales bacterium UBA9856]